MTSRRRKGNDQGPWRGSSGLRTPAVVATHQSWTCHLAAGGSARQSVSTKRRPGMQRCHLGLEQSPGPTQHIFVVVLGQEHILRSWSAVQIYREQRRLRQCAGPSPVQDRTE